MKNSILVWAFVIGIIAAVLFAFNYQGNKSTIPLSEIFPEEETFPVDVAYEFVDSEASKQENADRVPTPTNIESTESAIEAAKAVENTVEVSAKVKEDLTQPAAGEVPFTIQIASFKSKDAAVRSLAKVLDKGYKGFIVSRNLGEKGTWHRVYVGIFQDKPQAQDELSKVQQDYPGSFVIAPK